MSLRYGGSTAGPVRLQIPRVDKGYADCGPRLAAFTSWSRSCGPCDRPSSLMRPFVETRGTDFIPQPSSLLPRAGLLDGVDQRSHGGEVIRLSSSSCGCQAVGHFGAEADEGFLAGDIREHGAHGPGANGYLDIAGRVSVAGTMSGWLDTLASPCALQYHGPQSTTVSGLAVSLNVRIVIPSGGYRAVCVSGWSLGLSPRSQDGQVCVIHIRRRKDDEQS